MERPQETGQRAPCFFVSFFLCLMAVRQGLRLTRGERRTNYSNAILGESEHGAASSLSDIRFLMSSGCVAYNLSGKD
jgi:hypothetical protein